MRDPVLIKSELSPRNHLMGFPWWLSSQESACRVGDPGSIPGSEDPLEKGWLPTPIFLPGEFMD